MDHEMGMAAVDGEALSTGPASDAEALWQSYLSRLPTANASLKPSDPYARFWGDYFKASQRDRERAEDVYRRTVELLSSKSQDTSSVAMLKAHALALVTRATATMSAPDIEKILMRPLIHDGDTVHVVVDRRANDIIGLATCAQGGYAIVLGARPNSKFRLNPYAFLFFREHEFAHITKGHIVCQNGRLKRTGGKEQELEADCEAVRVLLEYPSGGRVIDRAWSVMDGMPGGDTPTHPAPRVRAEEMDKCDPRK
jgi:hypothetical protein